MADPIWHFRWRRPAPGYRRRDTGGLKYVGSRGYSWVSTLSGTNGMNFFFSVTALHPSYTTYRSYGLQLRCLSE